MTRRVLERRQAGGVTRRAPRAAASRGRDHGRGSDQPAEDEGAQPIRSALVAVHGTIVGVLICTLGDLLLDVIVLTASAAGPDSEGSVETRVGAGGQSANVAAWAASWARTRGSSASAAPTAPPS